MPDINWHKFTDETPSMNTDVLVKFVEYKIHDDGAKISSTQIYRYDICRFRRPADSEPTKYNHEYFEWEKGVNVSNQHYTSEFRHKQLYDEMKERLYWAKLGD